jgi:hypothetical protein
MTRTSAAKAVTHKQFRAFTLAPESLFGNCQIFVGHGFSRAVKYLESVRL